MKQSNLGRISNTYEYSAGGTMAPGFYLPTTCIQQISWSHYCLLGMFYKHNISIVFYFILMLT